MTLTDAWKSEGRAAVVARLKERRACLLQTFAKRLNFTDGLEAMYAYADAFDDILRDLNALTAQTVVPSESSPPPTIVAVGGFGRKELAPYSDIDLLFLLENADDATAQERIAFMVQILWDMGLKVGQAVRTVDDCINQARTEMTIRTNLLEARFVDGDRGLFDDFNARFTALCRETDGRDFVMAKVEERRLRYQRMGQSKYMLEPNVKEGRGGLRDLHLMFWLIKYLFGITNMPDLVSSNILSRQACAAFLKAHRFLTTVRCHLHLLNGRAGDVLTFEAQKQIALKMGYDNRSGQCAVERFMKHYYLICKNVGELSWLMTVIIGDTLNDGVSFSDIDSDFVLINDRISFKDTVSLDQNPMLTMRAFYLKQSLKKPVDPRTLGKITDNAKLARKLRKNPQANALFLDILAGESAETTLRQMLETGVLGYFMPDFQPLIAQVQFDLYHVYTTDEHTLKTLGFLERQSSEQAQRTLALAALLHDIGKGRGGKHEEIGAVLAQKVTADLGLDDAEAQDVVWLVRNHLLMSQVAFRRDIFDPKTIDDFVQTVQSPERLRRLFALTVADIKAVGPAVWNSFKEKLLSDLLSFALARMQGGGAHERVLTENQRKLAELPPSQSYSFSVSTDAERGVTEFIVLAPDHDGLFAEITGAMALCDVSVVEAQIATLDNKMALDTFLIQDTLRRPVESEKKIAKLKQKIEQAAQTDFEPMLAEKRKAAPKTELTVPLRVFIDNKASDKCTLIELNGTDAVGFLHLATYAMTRLHLRIVSAHIYTYGSRVVDVFYITDEHGNKIVDSAVLDNIKSTLAKVVSNADIGA